MIRTLTNLVTIWVLLAIPVLCFGGVLEHDCSDCSQEEVCSHEKDCPDDPCLEVIARTSSPGTDALGSLSVAALFRVSVVLDPRQAAEAPFGPTPAALPNLPRPPSDLPLLI